MIVVGLALLAVGARWLVEGATQIARAMGVSELVIGLTIVAGGTSLPEVGASIVAAFRGQRDIAVGNVVGSNIFNLLGILGAAAAISGGVPAAPGVVASDLPVMVACALACLPVFLTGLADVDQAQVLAALIVFRLLYLLLPFAAALVIVLVFERSEFRRTARERLAAAGGRDAQTPERSDAPSA